jgi:hypothetical protein
MHRYNLIQVLSFVDINQEICKFQLIESLLRLSKTNGVVANIVDRVPLSEESISENGEGSHGLGEVHTHEGRDARSLDLKNVVKSTNGEVVSSEGEGEVGQTVTLVALNSVLSVESLLGTNLLVAANDQRYILHVRLGETYRSSAMVEGRAMRDVPVSRITPVLSISAVSLPKVMASRSTSQ